MTERDATKKKERTTKGGSGDYMTNHFVYSGLSICYELAPREYFGFKESAATRQLVRQQAYRDEFRILLE
ncbi:MAG: hypothetical protein ACKVS6_17135 [Planctomycetota bacterium]